jgi:hypothetical protein
MIDNQKNAPTLWVLPFKILREKKNVFIQVGHQLHALYIGLASTIFFFFFLFSYYYY